MKDHVTVCVCTFRRSHLLPTLLHLIEGQITKDLFDVSVCIVDNDVARSAMDVVFSFVEKSSIQVTYVVEPEQNIAKARNSAIQNAKGEYIAFIDDDEVPGKEWILRLYEMIKKTPGSAVLGPVRPLLQNNTPRWVVKSGILNRPEMNTGTVLEWQDTRTGNILLESRLFKEDRFNESYGRGGEDKELFRRMIQKGEKFIWCEEAAVHEIIPLSRCTRVFQIRRALLRGKVAVPVRFKGCKRILVSSIAVICYIPLLLATVAFSQGLFMKYLVRACDHVGRILSFFGLNPVKENYLS